MLIILSKIKNALFVIFLFSLYSPDLSAMRYEREFQLNYDRKALYTKLLPHLKKVESYDYLDDKMEENAKEDLTEIRAIAASLLELSEIWPKDEPVPSGLAKSFAHAYAQMLIAAPQLLPQFEKIFIRLLSEEKVTYEDLWPKGLKKIIVSFKDTQVGPTTSYTAYTCTPCLELKRLISEFDGDGLIIGRGRKHGGYNPNKFFSLDIDKNCEPDAVGSASIVSHLRYFPNKRFKVLFFEHLDSKDIEQHDTAQEYFRMMQPGGILVYFGNKNQKEELEKIYSASKQFAIKENLTKAGYQNITMRISSPHSGEKLHFLCVTAERPKDK